MKEEIMIIINSAHINAAADAMWKWEQSGRTDNALHDEAKVTDYCTLHHLPEVVAVMIFDAIQITVRIANGYSPDYGGPKLTQRF
jgi:hypothetical protein